MFSQPGFWIAIVIVGVVAYALWSTSQRKWPIRITVDPTGVKQHHGLPSAKVASILQFFGEELDVEGKLVVMVARGRDGHLQTKFVGPIDPGTKQRVRNFLISQL